MEVHVETEAGVEAEVEALEGKVGRVVGGRDSTGI